MSDLTPGTKVKTAGQYVQVSASGEIMDDGAEVTLAGGDTAPPSDGPGNTWRLVDASKTKAQAVVSPPKPEPVGASPACTAPAGPYVSDVGKARKAQAKVAAAREAEAGSNDSG